MCRLECDKFRELITHRTILLVLEVAWPLSPLPPLLETIWRDIENHGSIYGPEHRIVDYNEGWLSGFQLSQTERNLGDLRGR